MNSTARTAGIVDWGWGVLAGAHPKRALLRVGLIIVTSFILFGFILLPIQVTGISMQPTYRDRGVNLINRLAYLFHPPRRGDVVALRTSEVGHQVMLLKRIVGLPGEHVAFHHGQLYINGRRIEEPYVRFPCDWDLEEVVGPGQYFVVGDNRSMPQADHLFGRADSLQIVGKALL